MFTERRTDFPLLEHPHVDVELREGNADPDARRTGTDNCDAGVVSVSHILIILEWYLIRVAK